MLKHVSAKFDPMTFKFGNGSSNSGNVVGCCEESGRHARRALCPVAQHLLSASRLYQQFIWLALPWNYADSSTRNEKFSRSERSTRFSCWKRGDRIVLNQWGGSLENRNGF